MKTKKSVTIAIGLLIGFAAGLMVGITLTNPGLSLMEAAGTIGKVDKYRNVRVTEADIELRDELLSDESLRESYKNYLMYEYTANVKMADDIQFAIAAVDDAAGFKTANVRTMDKLEDYAIFLDNARLQILEAIDMMENLSSRNQIAIKSVLNNAGNALAQTTYRSTVLFDFIQDIDQFIGSSSAGEYPRLAKAHDLLFANLLTACIINDNRPVLEHLAEKELLSDGEELALLSESLQQAVVQDSEQLQRIMATGSAQLQNNILESAESIGLFYNSEPLRGVLELFDAQKLGAGFPDSEQLRGIIWLDAEQLGVINDSESLNSMLSAKEQLQLGW